MQRTGSPVSLPPRFVSVLPLRVIMDGWMDVLKECLIEFSSSWLFYFILIKTHLSGLNEAKRTIR